MGTNIGGREFTDYRQENPSHSIDGGILRELYLQMTSPEEEQRKKAETAAKPPETPAPDAIGFLGQLVGDARNLAMDAVTGEHSGDRVLSSITPQLAAEYQRGKELQERIDSGAVNRTQLKPDEQKSLDAYDKVKKTIAQLPMYDRDSITRYVEKGIEQKARATPHEQPKPVAPRESSKPQERTAVPHVAKESSEPKKVGGAKPPRQDAPSPATPEKAAVPKAAQPAPPSRPTDVNTPSARQASGKPEPAITANIGNKDTRTVAGAQNVEQKRVVERQESSSGMTAANAFERRTAYDARVQSESKNNAAQSSESKLQARQNTPSETQESRIKNTFEARIQELSAEKYADKVHATGSFENMRKLLEERTATAGNAAQKKVFEEKNSIKSTGAFSDQPQPKSVPPDSAKNSPETVRVSSEENRRPRLSEVKVALAPARLQEIAQMAETKFPSGLRWENSLRHVDSNVVVNAQKHADVVLPPTHPSARSEGGVGRIVTTANVPNGAVLKSEYGNVVKTPDGVVAKSPESNVPKQPDGSVPKMPDSGVPKSPEAGVPKLPDSGVPKSPDGNTVRIADGIGKPQGKPITKSEVSSPSAKDQTSAGRGNALGAGLPNQASRMPEGQVIGGDKGAASVPLQTLTLRGRVEDRYITGVEIALAAIIAAAGAKRVRLDEMVAQGQDGKSVMPRVQKIDAFLPSSQNFKPDLFVDRKGLKSSDASSKEEEKKASVRDEQSGASRQLPTHKFARRTRLIGSGDTLVSIAESLGWAGDVAWLIADINTPRIKESFVDGKRIIEIRSRELIEIPTEEEANEFRNTRSKDLKGEDLVTVVIETQVDRELLDEQFGVFVDGESRQGTASGSRDGGYPSPVVPRTEAPILSRASMSAEGALMFPSLSLSSSNVFTVAKEKLRKLTRALKRNNIKRRF